jgi:hypothetical protein
MNVLDMVVLVERQPHYHQHGQQPAKKRGSTPVHGQGAISNQ